MNVPLAASGPAQFAPSLASLVSPEPYVERYCPQAAYTLEGGLRLAPISVLSLPPQIVSV